MADDYVCTTIGDVEDLTLFSQEDQSIQYFHA